MSLEDLLQDWMPRQRWFAGKDNSLTSVSVAVTRTLIEGDPALLHLLVDVEQDVSAVGARHRRYQVFVGARAGLPTHLE